MTVATTVNRYSYAGNGTTKTFAYSSKFLADGDLVVVEVDDATGVETTKTLTTHYTVSGAGDANGGTVTMLTAPASGKTLVIYSDPALTQAVDLVEGDPLEPETQIEQPLDRLTLIAQRIKDLIGRSVRFAEGVVLGSFSAFLPKPEAGAYLRVNVDGDGFEWVGSDPTDESSTFQQTGTGAVERTWTAKLGEIVTPEDFGAEGDGATNDASALQKWLNAIDDGAVGVLFGGRSYVTNSELTLSGAATIIVLGEVSITAGATIDNILRHASTLTITGGGRLTLDGDDNVTYAGLHSTAQMPRLENVKVTNCTRGFTSGADYTTATDDDMQGDGYLRRCEAANCDEIGFSYRGRTSPSKDATLVMDNCRTSGTTGSTEFAGSGNGFLFNIRNMASVRWIGGDYTGDSTAECTAAIRCDQCEILGGFYHDVAEGPSLGIDTKRFSVQGVVGDSLTGPAVHIDTTDGSGETVGVGIVDGCVAYKCGRVVRTTCSHVSVTNNRGYDCTSNEFAFAGAGTDVWCDGNSAYRSGSTAYAPFTATEGAVVRFGVNTSNSTNKNAYNGHYQNNNSYWIQPGATLVTSTPYTPSLQDRVLLVDCSSSAIDIDLPGATSAPSVGWTLDIIKLDATNRLTVTIDGGANVGKLQEGATTLCQIPANHQYRKITVVSKDITGSAGAEVVGYAVVDNCTPAIVDTTAIGNVGGGEDNLISYVMPGQTLYRDKRGVRITAWGTTANNSNPKTIKLYFGSTAIITTALTVSQAGVWRITAEVFRTGTDAQDYSAQLLQGGTTTLVDVEQGSLTEDDGASITIKCTGTVTDGGGGINNDDIVQEGLMVENIN